MMTLFKNDQLTSGLSVGTVRELQSLTLSPSFMSPQVGDGYYTVLHCTVLYCTVCVTRAWVGVVGALTAAHAGRVVGCNRERVRSVDRESEYSYITRHPVPFPDITISPYQDS